MLYSEYYPSLANKIVLHAIREQCKRFVSNVKIIDVVNNNAREINGFVTLTVNRFSGLTSIMPRSKFWQSGGTKCGMWKTPFFTFSKSWRKLSSSKGNAPTSRAYSITPHDQTSAFRPSYFSPCKFRVNRIINSSPYVYLKTKMDFTRITSGHA